MLAGVRSLESVRQESQLLSGSSGMLGLPDMQLSLKQFLARASHGEDNEQSAKAADAAQRLFASMSFDAAKLARDVKSLDAVFETAPSTGRTPFPADSCDIDGYLAAHRRTVIANALANATKTVQNNCDEYISSCAALSWEQDKQELLLDLSIHVYMPSEPLPTTTSLFSPVGSTKFFENEPASPLPHAAYAAALYNAVADNASNPATTGRAALGVNTLPFLQSAAIAAAGGSTAPSGKLWALLRSVFCTEPTVLRVLSDVSDNDDDGLPSAVNDASYATSVLTFLCTEYDEYMQRVVSHNPGVKTSRVEYGKLGTIRRFMTIKDVDTVPVWSSTTSREELRMAQHWGGFAVDGQSLWPQLYYCLRLGAWEEALKLVRGVSSAMVADHPLLAVVSAFANFNKDATSPCDPSLGKHMAGMKAMYDSVQTLERCGDPFMCEVLCVLSGANAEHMDAAVLRTLEDFVWHRLMFVVYSPLLTLRSAFDHGGGSHYSLQSLAEAVTITYGGADYFDHDKRRAYEYAYLLLMCNQPELALDYLALNGHTQHPNGSFDDVIHLALSLHWFSALHVLPFKYSSGAAPVSLFEPLGSTALVLRHVPSGVICVDLYMLLNRYLQLRFTGNVTAYALYLSLLRCLPARLTLLVQLTNAVGQTGYAELFGDAGSGKQGLLHELLRDSSQVTTVLSSAAAQAQREGRVDDYHTLAKLCSGK